MLQLFLWVVVFFTIIANFSIAILVFKKNPKSATHQLLALLSFITVLWTIFNYLALLPGPEQIRLFWVRTVMFFTTPYGTVILLLALTFPEAKLSLDKKILVGLVIFNIITASLAVSPYMFPRLENLPNGSFNLYPGPGIIVYAIGFIGFMTVGFIQLIRKYKRSKGLIKKQLQMFIFGIIASFSLLTLTNFIAVTVFRTIQYTALGPPFTLIMFAFTTYAIIKHRFLDIRLVVARSVAYTLLVLILGTFYAGALFLVGNYVIRQPTTSTNILFSTVLALIIAFTFQPLRRFLERTTDSVFYQDRYDSNKLLYDLALIMASNNRLEDLTHKLLHKILDEMKLRQGAFILTEKNRIYEVAHEGYQLPPEFDEKEVKALLSQPQTIIFEELPEGEIKNILRKMDFYIVLHLRTEGELIGLLTFAEKLSGNIYNNEDIQVLETLAHEAAVAIQNAKAYEEIRRFSITLQEEVKQATEELLEANKRLKEVDRLKDEFVSIASHELRTPMTAIKSYLWMVLNGKRGEIDERAKKYLDRAYFSTERLINLVNDMLDVSRIESGRIELELKPLDVSSLLDSVKHDFQAKAKELNLDFSVHVSADIAPMLADRERIYQVLENLIGNAFKFTPTDGKIDVTARQADSFIEIAVSDTGKGIRKDDLPKLFKKFGRLDNSLSSVSESGGTGLGLYICKQYVKMHQGKIWAESKLGKGSTFIFKIPIYKGKEKKEAAVYDRPVLQPRTT